MHPLRFPNSGIRAKGWQASARPAARGNRLRPRPPAKGQSPPAGMAGAYRRRQRPWPGRKGQPRGQGCRRAAAPAGVTPAQGGTTRGQ
ncbi:hypothetical protein GW17_00045390 [Ensete ventricosum]|nr:hypothetical protein GW17_00045390 [Ensete ventricosum]